MRGTVRERLLSRLVPDPATGCLLWTGTRNHGGYGVMSVEGKPTGIHRVAWELEHGPVPEGLVLDHVRDRGCRHRHCGNVAHLEPVTQRINILRGTSPVAAAARKPASLPGAAAMGGAAGS